MGDGSIGEVKGIGTIRIKTIKWIDKDSNGCTPCSKFEEKCDFLRSIRFHGLFVYSNQWSIESLERTLNNVN